ncbi:ATP-grasp domain-containing protein [Neobacillus sp.]|uniref:ATP-grasp domain-containing protein n=1 Tax=Neobacillus sp. TaxID=2675273 RepID=UPI00289754BF|nr:ATP-grasp domain-containing protein [Neobacillus sp.]
MNILLCSVGRRVKLVEYFKKELQKINGKVVAIDCDPTAAALHHADIYEVVPRIDDPEYIHHVKYLCNKYKIRGVISLIDPELPLLASYKEEFEKEGIQMIVSDKDIVDICYDKDKTYKFLQANKIPSIPTYAGIDRVRADLKKCKINFPLIVKPKNGSASMGIHIVSSIEELKVSHDKLQEYIVQPFITGDELGVDCYIDFHTKKATNIFIKQKLKMRDGETDKSISVKDPVLKQMIEKLIDALKPIGPIDIDCFKSSNGYVISEINPRFGGGYLHAHESGQNFIKNIINNINGNPNRQHESEYAEGTIMVKYDHFMFL